MITKEKVQLRTFDSKKRARVDHPRGKGKTMGGMNTNNLSFFSAKLKTMEKQEARRM
jgi:hypothetical protein